MPGASASVKRGLALALLGCLLAPTANAQAEDFVARQLGQLCATVSWRGTADATACNPFATSPDVLGIKVLCINSATDADPAFDVFRLCPMVCCGHTHAPTARPTANPTASPATSHPTTSPTGHPTPNPTASPAANPTASPSAEPTRRSTAPTTAPTGCGAAAVADLLPIAVCAVHYANGLCGEPIAFGGIANVPIRAACPHTCGGCSVAPTQSPTQPPSLAPTLLPTTCAELYASNVDDNPEYPAGYCEQTRHLCISDGNAEFKANCVATCAGCSKGPTASPTEIPTSNPTGTPTGTPTAAPTADPTAAPTTPVPTVLPTALPTTPAPTALPTGHPASSEPTALPSLSPTSSDPTVVPTRAPSAYPTAVPTQGPSVPPTRVQTVAPTSTPTSPTAAPLFALSETYIVLPIPQNVRSAQYSASRRTAVEADVVAQTSAMMASYFGHTLVQCHARMVTNFVELWFPIGFRFALIDVARIIDIFPFSIISAMSGGESAPGLGLGAYLAAVPGATLPPTSSGPPTHAPTAVPSVAPVVPATARPTPAPTRGPSSSTPSGAPSMVPTGSPSGSTTLGPAGNNSVSTTTSAGWRTDVASGSNGDAGGYKPGIMFWVLVALAVLMAGALLVTIMRSRQSSGGAIGNAGGEYGLGSTIVSSTSPQTPEPVPFWIGPGGGLSPMQSEGSLSLGMGMPLQWQSPASANDSVY